MFILQAMIFISFGQPYYPKMCDLKNLNLEFSRFGLILHHSFILFFTFLYLWGYSRWCQIYRSGQKLSKYWNPPQIASAYRAASAFLKKLLVSLVFALPWRQSQCYFSHFIRFKERTITVFTILQSLAGSAYLLKVCLSFFEHRIGDLRRVPTFLSEQIHKEAFLRTLLDSQEKWSMIFCTVSSWLIFLFNYGSQTEWISYYTII